ncbi:MAG: carboxypeptidase M32 [Nanoarchaeota archaeon]|nr:carboxypeptidase M32 [Nanoarchaeota archaeon]
MNQHLQELKKMERELKLLGGTAALLHWDRSTMIPKKAVPQRAEQLSYLSSLIHDKLTSPHLKKTIKALGAVTPKLSLIDRRIVQEYQKNLHKIEKIPKSHVEAFSKLEIESAHAWEIAREKKQFSHFAPYLEKVLAMKLKEARFVDPKKHPYNVLLDDFEEGMTFEKLDPVFEKLKTGLIEIITTIKKSAQYKQQKDVLASVSFPVDAQKKVAADIKNRILQAPDRHTDAESVHPFTTRISDDDVRITTAYREGQPLFSFTSTVHESGHALYELGFSPQLRGTTLCDAPSFGLHESQSRLWENQIVKSREFWKFYYPYYITMFPALKKISLEQFYSLVNQVRPSLVRIECDEVTYCLHIVIRYELEKSLLEGKLKVKDLPQAWNEKYKQYLGVTPKNDVQGVLQDMHWSEGLFGYFPTYAIGTMYSAMIFRQLQQDHPAVLKEISHGDFTTVRRWLKEKIHRHGSMYLSEEIITKACRKNLTPDDFIDYLKNKYYSLYGIKQ